VSTISFPSSPSTVTTTQDLSQAKSAQALRVLEEKSTNDSLRKIDKAARDFESILLGEWLEKAEKSFASVPGSDPDEDNDPGRDQFQSIGCQFLGEALSKAGGIGIASMISKHLHAVEARRNPDGESKEAAPISLDHGKLQNHK
jgi:Rod binding domain-containing protein